MGNSDHFNTFLFQDLGSRVDELYSSSTIICIVKPDVELHKMSTLDDIFVGCIAAAILLTKNCFCD